MTSHKTKIDAIFSEWDKPDSPGCALAIVRAGETIYERGYGIANLEYDIPITPETRFHVASVSKQFTAMAVTLLVQEGKLSLDSDIHEYLPKIPDFGIQITPRHLLHHTSGLRDQWSLLTIAGWRMQDVITTEDIIELVQAQKALNFKPGAEYLYSNTGYTLLALIVERLSGQTFPEFCRTQIFTPLGMENTHFHHNHTMIVKNMAYSYAPNEKNGFHKVVLSYSTVGATSLFTTVQDLGKWDENFYTHKVGGPKVFTMLHTRGVLNTGQPIRYALGLFISHYRGLKTVEHGGSDAGYRAHLIRFPDQRFTIIILGNLSTLGPSQLTTKIADIYLENEFLETEEQEEPIKLPIEALVEKANIYYNENLSTTIRIEMIEDKLYWVRTSGNIELQPLSPERFKLADPDPSTIIEFSKPTPNSRTQMNWFVQTQKPIVYRAVDPYDPTDHDKENYSGRYFCPELDVTYTILNEEGKLFLKRRKHEKTLMIPTFKDAYTREDSDILFTRDNENAISGFTLTTERVRNLRFIKHELRAS